MAGMENNEISYNHCEKNKPREKCQTNRCLIYNKYNLMNVQMPCPFYREDDCGFLFVFCGYATVFLQVGVFVSSMSREFTAIRGFEAGMI